MTGLVGRGGEDGLLNHLADNTHRRLKSVLFIKLRKDWILGLRRADDSKTRAAAFELDFAARIDGKLHFLSIRQAMENIRELLGRDRYRSVAFNLGAYIMFYAHLKIGRNDLYL